MLGFMMTGRVSICSRTADDFDDGAKVVFRALEVLALVLAQERLVALHF